MRIEVLNEPSCSPKRCEGRLSAIRSFLKPSAVGAELGVFKGVFSEYLLSTNPSKLYLVDPWYRLYNKWNWAKDEKSTLSAFLAILTEYRHEIEQGVVEPVVEFSEIFLSNLPDQTLDWVYIDTSHSYGQTLKELTWCLTKVKRDGYIIGDDFYSDENSNLHGVYVAVKELEAAGKLKLIMAGEACQFVAQSI